MQPLKSLRVICEPRAVFRSAAQQGGPSVFFGLVAAELLLTHTRMLIGACLRAPGAPVVAVMTLVQTLLQAVSGPLLMLLVVATAYNLVARLRGRGADLWAILGALSYAWVPHTLGLALWACLRCTEGLSQDGLRAPVLMLAPMLYGAIALQTLWRQGSVPSQLSRLASPRPKARIAAWGVCLTYVLAGLCTAQHVQTNWAQMRPKLAGDALPPFFLEGINAARLDSDALTGHVTLLDFWATWCGPCMQAMPELERLHTDYAARGLRVVAVNIEPGNRAGIQSVIDAQKLSLPVYLDTAQLAEQMHVHVYPTSFLVDADGHIVHVYSGPADAAELEQRIVMLLGRPARLSPL